MYKYKIAKERQKTKNQIHNKILFFFNSSEMERFPSYSPKVSGFPNKTNWDLPDKLSYIGDFFKQFKANKTQDRKKQEVILR